MEPGASQKESNVLRVAISGVSSPQKYDSLKLAIPGRVLYQQGTDERLLVDFHTREEAQRAVVNLNLLHGVHALILGEPATIPQSQ